MHSLIVYSLLLATLAFGQPPPQSADSRAQQPPLTVSNLRVMKDQEAFETFPIMNTNGNTVAQLSSIIFDWESGRAKFAVLLLFENITDRRSFTVVPWELLKFDTNSSAIVILASNDKLRRAPVVDPEKLPPRTGGNWGQEFYAHFEVTSGRDAVGTSGLPGGVVQGAASRLPDVEDPVGRGLAFYLWGAGFLLVLAVGWLFVTRKRWTG